MDYQGQRAVWGVLTGDRIRRTLLATDLWEWWGYHSQEKLSRSEGAIWPYLQGILALTLCIYATINNKNGWEFQITTFALQNLIRSSNCTAEKKEVLRFLGSWGTGLPSKCLNAYVFGPWGSKLIKQKIRWRRHTVSLSDLPPFLSFCLKCQAWLLREWDPEEMGSELKEQSSLRGIEKEGWGNEWGYENRGRGS